MNFLELSTYGQLFLLGGKQEKEDFPDTYGYQVQQSLSLIFKSQ